MFLISNLSLLIQKKATFSYLIKRYFAYMLCIYNVVANPTERQNSLVLAQLVYPRSRPTHEQLAEWDRVEEPVVQ